MQRPKETSTRPHIKRPLTDVSPMLSGGGASLPPRIASNRSTESFSSTLHASKEAEAPPHTSGALATLDVGDMPTIERSAARRVCSLEQVPRGKPFHPHLFSKSNREPQGPRRPLHTSGRFDHNSPKCRISLPLTEWKLESCCTEASCSVK
mmetsp:Transcript_4653/g.7120  ORF Transcript_4653/g.7120 Transcript_4653/m.7120 type:complete len:151 (+) Transcript_4653:5958-6410(+)